MNRRPRWLIFGFLGLLFVLMQKQIWLSDSGFFAIHRLTAKINQAQLDNQALQDRNQTVLRRVVRLKVGDEAIEQKSRSELGLIKQGEVFYQIAE